MNLRGAQAFDLAIARALEDRRQRGEERTLKNTGEGIDFASNDYLGYAREKGIWERVCQRLERETRRMGSTGSRLLTGHDPLLDKVEAKLAAFHGSEAGLILNSGFDLNLGLLACLLGKEDLFIFDERIHASLKDGARLSGCRRLPFRHNDLSHLEKRLQGAKACKRLVAVESLYSMDGDWAPLMEMVELCERYGAALVVDEAHATGIRGPQGRGLVSELGLEERVFARVHTFGKALGAHGAVLLGSQKLRDYLINFCHPLIYSTALPPHAVLCIDEAYEMMKRDEEGRKRLRQNISLFLSLMRSSSLDSLLPGTAVQNETEYSPILPLMIPDREKLKRLHRYLQDFGFNVYPIFSPTVARGTERLRPCFHSFNSPGEIQQFVSLLQSFFKDQGL